MGIGTVLKKRRKKIGLSLTEAAAKLGICRSFLAKIEANKNPPKLATLRQMAEDYEMPLWILMAFVNDGVSPPQEMSGAIEDAKTALLILVKEFL